MRKVEVTLPSSGKKAVVREATGMDEFAAARKFLNADEAEKNMENLEILARCTEIDGKPLGGYEELLRLPSKDISFLFLVFRRLNTLSNEEVQRIDDFFHEEDPSLNP